MRSLLEHKNGEVDASASTPSRFVPVTEDWELFFGSWCINRIGMQMDAGCYVYTYVRFFFEVESAFSDA